MVDIASMIYFGSMSSDIKFENGCEKAPSEAETVEMMSYVMLASAILALTTLGIVPAPYGAFSRCFLALLVLRPHFLQWL